MQGTASNRRDTPGQRTARRKPSVLVRVLIAILIVLAVGGISFLIGYVIGLQLGMLEPWHLLT
jgi:hypothetical protein